MTFDFSYPGTPANERGWGAGWPDCQTDKLEPLTIQDRNGRLIPIATHAWKNGKFERVPFPGGVRTEIHELLTLILRELDRRGVDFMDPGCWAFGCRATKTSSGSQTQTPSNHSWGLAVDLNAPRNAFGTARENAEFGQPNMAWVNRLFKRFGFRWLGPPIDDWMHWDFAGNRKDARTMTAKARAELGATYRFKGKTYRRLRGLLAAMREHLTSKSGDFSVTIDR